MNPSPWLVRAALIIACVCALSACAQPRPYADLWVDPRPYHADQTTTRPGATALTQTDEPSPSSAPTNPVGTITLYQAVGLALRHNPELSAAGWEVTAAELDATQMGQSPNPRATFAAENFAGPNAGDTFERQTLRLSQVIELADKRSKRTALGRATQRLRAWDYEQKRVDLAARTTARYIKVVVAQQRLALTKKQLKIAEAGYEIANDRATNGESPGLERDQAEARVALGRIALEQSRQVLVASRADLVATWGADQPGFETAIGDLNMRVIMPSLEVLQDHLATSPFVARWNDEIAQRWRAFELERAKAVADPTIGVGMRYFPDIDDTAGLVEVSVPLTVLDDNRFATRAARLRITKAHAERQQAQTEASRILVRAHARKEAAAFALKTLDDQALPAVKAAYEASLESYTAGLTDYLTVLDAERTLLDTQNQRLDALLVYHLAVVDLERIIGGSLDGK